MIHVHVSLQISGAAYTAGSDLRGLIGPLCRPYSWRGWVAKSTVINTAIDIFLGLQKRRPREAAE